MNLFDCGEGLALESLPERQTLPRPIPPRGLPFRRPFPPPPIRNILGEAQCRHLARNACGGNREKSNFSAPRDTGPAEITSRKLEPAQTVF
jgi:hypothetical protein